MRDTSVRLVRPSLNVQSYVYCLESHCVLYTIRVQRRPSNNQFFKNLKITTFEIDNAMTFVTNRRSLPLEYPWLTENRLFTVRPSARVMKWIWWYLRSGLAERREQQSYQIPKQNDHGSVVKNVRLLLRPTTVVDPCETQDMADR